MDSNLNTRLALTNPEKRVGEYDDEDLIEITPEDEIYGLKICGRNLAVFLYAWDHNRNVWTEEHFLELINYLIEIEWDEGLKALLESPTSHEIYISLPLENEIFPRLLEQATEAREEDGKAENDLMTCLTKSPYCINMAVVKDKKLAEDVKLAKQNLQDQELNVLILRGDVPKYQKLLKDAGDEATINSMIKYQTFHEAHFKVQLGEALQKLNTKKESNIELFDTNPKLAHLNLHQNLNIDEKKLPKYMQKMNWTFPSYLLLTENIECFDNSIRKYRPMSGMIFRDADPIEGDDDKEWVSLLQLLCEYHKDSIVMFNCLENHPSMFTFKTLYNLVKNVISNGVPQQARILNSKAVKSYFTFLSDESQRKVSTLFIVYLTYALVDRRDHRLG